LTVLGIHFKQTTCYICINSIQLHRSVGLGRGELKIPKFALLLAVGLLVLVPSISAQDTIGEDSVIAEDPHRIAEMAMTFGDSASPAMQGTGSSVWVVIRMILVLALAAAAIYGVVFILKKTSRQTVSNNPFLKVLTSAHVGSNRYVHIVSVGSKAWLIGAGEGGVNLISEIDDKDVINAMLLEDSRKSAETTGPLPDFLSILRRLGTPAQTRSSGADEIRKRRERLKGM